MGIEFIESPFSGVGPEKEIMEWEKMMLSLRGLWGTQEAAGYVGLDLWRQL